MLCRCRMDRPDSIQELLVLYVVLRGHVREFVRFTLLSALPAQRQTVADHLNIILNATRTLDFMLSISYD